LPPGSHTVWAYHTKYAPGSASVSVGLGTPAQAEIRLSEGGTIRGTVTVAGIPESNAYINVYGSVGGSRSGRTDDAGHFEINGLDEGDFNVSARMETRTRNVAAQVANGLTTEVNIDFPSATGRVHGVVYDADGTPFHQQSFVQAAVTAADGSTERQSAQIQSDGSYSFENVVAGSVALTVHYMNTTKQTEVQLRDGESLRHDIHLNAGNKVHVSIQGSDPNTHMVTVVVVRGEVDLALLQQDFTAFGMEIQNRIAASGMAQNGSVISMGGIEAGDYTVLALRYDTASQGDPAAMMASMRVATQRINISDQDLSIALAF
jgi:hypothetical protein